MRRVFYGILACHFKDEGDLKYEGEKPLSAACPATAIGHFMRRTRAVLLLSLSLAFISVLPSGAVFYGHGMNWQSFCVKNPTVNSTWLTPINGGRNAWNNHASFPGSIWTASDCRSYMEVGSYGASWFGLYTPLSSGVRYRIPLDSGNINGHVQVNGYTFANVVRSVTAHEFGHSLRLGDHSNYPTRLMSSSRNRNAVTGPTTTEVIESNSYYYGRRQHEKFHRFDPRMCSSVSHSHRVLIDGGASSGLPSLRSEQPG